MVSHLCLSIFMTTQKPSSLGLNAEVSQIFMFPNLRPDLGHQTPCFLEEQSGRCPSGALSVVCKSH